MKIISSTLLAGFAALALTSCLDNDTPTQTVIYNLSYNNSYVIDYVTPGAEPEFLPGAKYEFKFNITANTCIVSVEDLTLVDDGASYKFSLPETRYTVDTEGFVNLSIPAAEVVIGNATLSISDFKLRQAGAIVDGNKQALYYDISYTVDNKYVVKVVQSNNIFNTRTVVTNLNDNSVQTIYTPYSGYSFNLKKNNAQVGISRLTVDGIFRAEINFEGLNYTPDRYMGFTFNADEIKATDYNGREIPNFKVTEFNSRLSYTPELFLSFVVNDTLKVYSQGSYKSLKPAETNPK